GLCGTGYRLHARPGVRPGGDERQRRSDRTRTSARSERRAHRNDAPARVAETGRALRARDDVRGCRAGHRNDFRTVGVSTADMTTTAATMKTQLLIGGAWRDASTGATYEDVNPATGAALADVAEATREDVDAAVTAARKAFDAGKWASMAASRRAKIVYKMAQLIGER